MCAHICVCVSVCAFVHIFLRQNVYKTTKFFIATVTLPVAFLQPLKDDSSPYPYLVRQIRCLVSGQNQSSRNASVFTPNQPNAILRWKWCC